MSMKEEMLRVKGSNPITTSREDMLNYFTATADDCPPYENVYKAILKLIEKHGDGPRVTRKALINRATYLHGSDLSLKEFIAEYLNDMDRLGVRVEEDE